MLWTSIFKSNSLTRCKPPVSVPSGLIHWIKSYWKIQIPYAGRIQHPSAYLDMSRLVDKESCTSKPSLSMPPTLYKFTWKGGKRERAWGSMHHVLFYFAQLSWKSMRRISKGFLSKYFCRQTNGSPVITTVNLSVFPTSEIGHLHMQVKPMVQHGNISRTPGVPKIIASPSFHILHLGPTIILHLIPTDGPQYSVKKKKLLLLSC